MADHILVLRTPSGLSGDMLVSGLAAVSGLDAAAFAAALTRVGLAELEGAARVVPRSVDGIAGVGLEVVLPPAHAHRRLPDIEAIIEASDLAQPAKDMAARAFGILAAAEAAVHGARPEAVHFHEVGAQDSILDVCLACELFVRLAPARFICSPLPVCDGTVRCAHGTLATPAPAVLHLLKGMPIYGIDSTGETVTPTAAALLQAMGAQFGPWPALVLGHHVRAFGGRVLPGVPNGAIFALGQACERPQTDGADPQAGDHDPTHGQGHAPSHDHGHDDHSHPHSTHTHAHGGDAS
jgi:pyridinium-3,5-bisthiocarboxylic acid mononucleotide nickel chelatase